MKLAAFRSCLLALTSLAFGAIFSCALPFVALATAAARSMSAPFAYGTVVAVWLVDQSLGFTVRHYPHDGSTIAWGAVIGLAAVAATVAARRAPTFTIAFVLAFVVDQGILAAYGAVQHSLSGFTPAIVAKIALVDIVCLAILAPLAFAPKILANARGDRDGVRREA